ncbi:efflux transporter outer membrane subunit, partial [Candidatus Magnetobacterium casense]
MIRYLSLITCVLVCLTGCSFTPKYTQPEAPVPAQWPTGEAYKALKTADIPTPQLRWQEFFTDARMQQLIETALNNNRDLRLAALSVERTRALYGIERAGLLPTASATVSDSNKRSSYDSVRVEEPRTTQQYSVNLGIASWEIDFFGRISSLKDAALQQYLSTQQARRSAQLSLISAVADTYLSLAANLEILALAKSTLDVQQATYELIKRRYDVGLASELDIRRVQTQVATASGDVARYTQLAAQGENALNLLVGSPIPQELLPVDLSSVSPLDDIFPDLSSEVLLSRPDVIEAEAILKAASANIGAARAAFFPRISLTAAIGTTSDELSGLFKSASGTWSFAPQITMPIFDARTRPALRVSKADMDVALTQYEKA